MTDAELKTLEALCEKATPGPWDCDQNGDGFYVNYKCSFLPKTADMEFMDAARTAVPALIARVRELEEALGFYADEKNWITQINSEPAWEFAPCEATNDMGDKARAGLEKSK